MAPSPAREEVFQRHVFVFVPNHSSPARRLHGGHLFRPRGEPPRRAPVLAAPGGRALSRHRARRRGEARRRPSARPPRPHPVAPPPPPPAPRRPGSPPRSPPWGRSSRAFGPARPPPCRRHRAPACTRDDAAV